MRAQPPLTCSSNTATTQGLQEKRGVGGRGLFMSVHVGGGGGGDGGGGGQINLAHLFLCRKCVHNIEPLHSLQYGPNFPCTHFLSRLIIRTYG